MKLNILLEQNPQSATRQFITREQQIQQLQNIVFTYVRANPGAAKRIIEFILKTQGTILKAKPIQQRQPTAGLPHEQPTQFQQALKGGNFELESFTNEQQHIMEIFGLFNKAKPKPQPQPITQIAPKPQQPVSRDEALAAIRQLRLLMNPHQKTLFVKQLNQIPGVQQQTQQTP